MNAIMTSFFKTVMKFTALFFLYQQASERELMWVLRITIIIVGTLSTLIAMFSTTIYGLFVLCSDLMYVVLFPQLTLALWMPQTNAYGSLAGFLASLILRILSGEPVLHIPAIIKYPFFDEDTQTQLFPHRTLVMLIGAILVVLVSIATNFLFLKGLLPKKYDVLKCHRQRNIKYRYSHGDLKDSVDNGQTIHLRSTNHEIQS